MPQANNIDKAEIKRKLKADSNPLSREALQLIEALERALVGSERVLNLAMAKLREKESKKET